MKYHVEKRPAANGSKNSGGFLWAIVDELGRDCGYSWFGPEQAEEQCKKLEWESELPIGVRTSSLLVAVRAVCSKAWTSYHANLDGPHTAEEVAQLNDLYAVYELLEGWARTSRPPKYEP